MAGAFSQELEDLLNPLPKFADPEDDGDDTTRARVEETFSDDDQQYEVGSSALRKNNTTLLSDTDRRYVGKKISRKQLLMDIEGSEEEEEEEGDEEKEEEEEEYCKDDDGDGSIEKMKDYEPMGFEEEEEEEDDNDDPGLLSKSKSSIDTSFPKGVDFHKLTEGMDDLGVSEEEDGDSGEEIEGGSDENDGFDDDEEEDGEEEESVRTFSQDKVDEEVEKGKAVCSQLALWDQLLEGRIKIQRALASANRLPQPHSLPEFKRRGGAGLGAGLKNAHKAVKALQRSLLELHDHLLLHNTDTRAVTGDQGEDHDQDEEIDSEDDVVTQEKRAPKRKLEMAEYPDLMAKRFAAFQPYCNATLQKWHDKTRLTMGKTGKSFGAFDRNILTQVEQVLMDRERLVKRTQTRRSEYRVLGKAEASALASEAVSTEGLEGQQLKANTHLKDLDEDIFDDDDFYHQLLRELIERRTSAADPNDQVAMGRQWLAIQKLRSKIKKKVDTKASKGRKVRFHIHSKLVNFMAPMDNSSMSEEARSELYRSLFGQTPTARA